MILLAGQRIKADQALDWGLVDHLAEDALAGALTLAADALGADPRHVQRMKAMFKG
jgi:enoyl-CoA hydratase/carnithine racemase